jgi:hypothetical protein
MLGLQQQLPPLLLMQHQASCLVNGVPLHASIGTPGANGKSLAQFEYVPGQHDQPFDASTLCMRCAFDRPKDMA